MERIENKAAYVTRSLARRLLSVEPGDRIPTTSDIAAELGVGFGTVEKAILALRDGDIIKTRARGQMGTFLLERDLQRQWTVAGLGSVVGLLPMPNSMLFVALATGMTAWLERTGVPFTLNFKNGGHVRIAALLDGRADFVVVSKKTAAFVCEAEPSLAIAFNLADETYYAGHHIMTRADLDKPRDQWVIGVDPTSYDHVAFCEALFPDAARKEVRYVNLPYAIAKGEIDASTVHSRALVPLEAAQSLLVEPTLQWDARFHDASAAAVVYRRDNEPIRAVFSEAEDPQVIQEIQRLVLNGEREPEY